MKIIELREQKRDDTDKKLITYIALRALKEKLGEAFEYDYDIEKFEYFVTRMMQADSSENK